MVRRAQLRIGRRADSSYPVPVYGTIKDQTRASRWVALSRRVCDESNLSKVSINKASLKIMVTAHKVVTVPMSVIDAS